MKRENVLYNKEKIFAKKPAVAETGQKTIVLILLFI